MLVTGSDLQWISIRKIVLIIVSVLLITGSSLSQVDQEERVEISVEGLSDEYFVIPTGEQGLVVFGDTGDRDKKGDNKWKILKYDTDFEKEGSKYISLDRKFILQGHYLDGEILYILFSRNINSNDYQLVTVDVTSFGVSSIGGVMPRKFMIEEFVVFDNYLYLSGNNLKEDVVAYANLNNRIIKTMEFDYKGTTKIENLKVNEDDQVVEFVISNYYRNKGLVYIHSFTDGKFLEEIIVDPKGGNNLVSAKISKITEDESIVAGTFAENKLGSAGMYLSKISGGKQDFITYHKFVDFDNFFSFLPKRRQEKIEQKQAKKEKKGKDIKIKYNLLTHDIISRDGEYLLIAEAYYPTYRYETRYGTALIYGAYRSVRREVKVFDGWQYTHGVVAGFNSDGELLWDQSFVMNDYKSYTLKERIRVNFDGDVVEMVYGSGNSIRTKVIQGSSVVNKARETGISTGKRYDEVRRSWASNLEYWYDDYFVIWGIQTIKNTKTKGDKKRKVFYFNKLRVQ